MRVIFQTSQFKKDFRKIMSRGKDIEKLKSVVKVILAGEPMEERHHDHPLSGQWTGSRDCHIEPDWVLIYRMAGDCLYLERTGSHSDLFR
jgi:mRNA interferase YafQ